MLNAQMIADSDPQHLVGLAETELGLVDLEGLLPLLKVVFGPLVYGHVAEIKADPGKVAQILEQVQLRNMPNHHFVINAYRLDAARRVPGADLKEILSEYQHMIPEGSSKLSQAVYENGSVADVLYNTAMIAAMLGNFTMSQAYLETSASSAPESDTESLWRARGKDMVDQVSWEFERTDGDPTKLIHDLYTLHQKHEGNCKWVKKNIPLHIAGFLLLLPVNKWRHVPEFDDCLNLGATSCLEQPESSQWRLVGTMLLSERFHKSNGEERDMALGHAQRFLDDQDAVATPSSSIAWVYRMAALWVARNTKDPETAKAYAERGVNFLDGVGGTEVATVIETEFDVL